MKLKILFIFISILLLSSSALALSNNSDFQINKMNFNQGSENQASNPTYNLIQQQGQRYDIIENSQFSAKIGLIPFENFIFNKFRLIFPLDGQIVNFGNVNLTYDCIDDFNESIIFGSRNNGNTFDELKDNANEFFYWTDLANSDTFQWYVRCTSGSNSFTSDTFRFTTFFVQSEPGGVPRDGEITIEEKLELQNISIQEILLQNIQYTDKSCSLGDKSKDFIIQFEENISTETIQDLQILDSNIECDNLDLISSNNISSGVKLSGCNCNDALINNDIEISIKQFDKLNIIKIDFEFQDRNILLLFSILIIIFILLLIIEIYRRNTIQ